MLSVVSQTLVDDQEVVYDFTYHKSRFKANFPVIVLSNKPSLVGCCSFTRIVVPGCH